MSNYSPTVYYLKYRPQSLDQLIGQESIKKILAASFQNNKLSHAYLLVGPRGTGKTSTARILAKMVNCENQQLSVFSNQLSDKSQSVVSGSVTEKLKTDEPKSENREPRTDNGNIPCNKCPACISITDGSNLDLIEIDAASNRGIEDIRSLRDKIKLSPSAARKKVYIIDEVHMLTTEAFNALLKTLEEPPLHALFILATTDSAKIPQTILSRVQRLDFKLATQEELLQVLTRIVRGEKIDIDEEALKALAQKSDGSFRDGVKLLDQVASIGEKITVQLIAESFKSSQFENILDLIQSLKNKNSQEGLLNIGRQISSGVDVWQLILSLMDVFRSLVLIKNQVGEELVKAHLTKDKYQSLVDISAGFTNQDLVKALDILQDALEKLKFASIPSLPLELAVVEICDGNSKFKIQNSKLEETVKVQKDSENNSERPGKPRGPENQASSEGQNVRDSDVPAFRHSDTPSNSESFRNSPSEFSENIKPEAITEHPLDIAKLKEKWTFVLETIRPFNFSLEALLRSISIIECTANAVIIEVPYAFHQRILEAPKNRDLLEGVFSDILGRSIRISTVLGKHIQKHRDIANIEVAEDDDIIRVAAEIFNSDSIN